MDMEKGAAGRPAAYFVFVVFIMAEFLLEKLEFFIVDSTILDEGQ